MSQDNWHAMKVQEALEALDTNKQGLAEEEVQNRLNKFGLNQLIEEKKITPLASYQKTTRLF
jgi:magnesium-transporting ATPase (P-type)